MITGACAMLKCLQNENLDVVFGYPGAVICPFYDELEKSDIKHILVRQEQNAGHAASGYARISGKVGVCIATSGPGATNLITALATSYMDSIPLVAITGQVESNLLGRDVFQEADITGSAEPFTKHSYLVKNVCDIPRVFKEAFYIARTGRPGPVLIDIPIDIQEKMFDYKPYGEVNIRSYKPTYEGNIIQIKKIAKAVQNSKRPLICVGGGVFLANAKREAVLFAEKLNLSAVSTMMGIGVFEPDRPCFFGMIGVHGNKNANMLLKQTDCLIIIGARVCDRAISNDNSSSNQSVLSKDATIIHIDVDPAEIGKNIKVDIPLVGDCKAVLNQLMKYCGDKKHDNWASEFVLDDRVYAMARAVDGCRSGADCGDASCNGDNIDKMRISDGETSCEEENIAKTSTSDGETSCCQCGNTSLTSGADCEDASCNGDSIAKTRIGDGETACCQCGNSSLTSGADCGDASCDGNSIAKTSTSDGETACCQCGNSSLTSGADCGDASCDGDSIAKTSTSDGETACCQCGNSSLTSGAHCDKYSWQSTNVSENNQNTLVNNFDESYSKLSNAKNPSNGSNMDFVSPKILFTKVNKYLENNAIITLDVGQSLIWAMSNIKINNGRFLTSGGMGTMGYSLPCAIGAKIADEKRQVVAICGDGAFQMCFMELATLVQFGVCIKIIVLKNNSLGLVREVQKYKYNSRFSQVDIGAMPDFKLIAKAYGISSATLKNDCDISKKLDELFENDESFVLECLINPDEKTI